MNILELKKYFQDEISEIYSTSEQEVLFEIFADKLLGLNKIELRNLAHNQLDINQQAAFYNKIFQLKLGKPYQQIIGETEFFGLKFFVNENVLIPRPETEELLELAISPFPPKGAKINGCSKMIGNITAVVPPSGARGITTILDIGTGSGVIAIVMKKYFPDAEVSAMDFSEKALEIARKNAAFHQVDINFIFADYLNCELQEKYDIIISNPPYIGLDEEREIADSVKDYEPKMALFSPTTDPLIFYRKIAKDAENALKENGKVFLEINQKFGAETLKLFENFPKKSLLKDLSGNDRFIIAEK